MWTYRSLTALADAFSLGEVFFLRPDCGHLSIRCDIKLSGQTACEERALVINDSLQPGQSKWINLAASSPDQVPRYEMDQMN